MLTRLRDKGLLWPALMTFAGVILGLSLGTWQMQRRAWKNELISTIEARTGIAPLPPEAWPNLKCQTVQEVGLELSCEYMKVTLRGTWDHARERHVFICGAQASERNRWARLLDLHAAVFADGATEIFVNRGFVPAGRQGRSAARTRSTARVVVEVSGMLRSAEPRARFSGQNDEARNIWYVRSPYEFLGQEFIAKRLPLIKIAHPPGPHPWQFYVDQISPPPAGGLPLPLAGKIELPNRHLEYALTWFSLAATLLAVFGIFASRRYKN